MYLGYQNEKIKFYTEALLDKELYGLDKIEETQEEYVLDGEEYVLKNEEWEKKQAEKERQRLDMLSLTKREVFLALYRAREITPDMIKAQIKDNEALIEFEYANDYFRGNPLINQIGAMLGYTSDDLDYLFINKKLPAAAGADESPHSLPADTDESAEGNDAEIPPPQSADENIYSLPAESDEIEEPVLPETAPADAGEPDKTECVIKENEADN